MVLVALPLSAVDLELAGRPRACGSSSPSDLSDLGRPRGFGAPISIDLNESSSSFSFSKNLPLLLLFIIK